jgi:uncharacterized BrkB/YihY/UPF0761 family membrane protein
MPLSARQKTLIEICIGASLGILGNVAAQYLGQLAMGWESFSQLPSTYHLYGIVGTVGVLVVLFVLWRLIRER